MAIRVPRQLRGEQRREALLTAAANVVSEHGPAGFSARAVAAQAQLPLAAVSYYFPRLDELLDEAIKAVLRSWLLDGEAAVAELITARHSGPAAAATAIVAALLPPGPSTAVLHRYQQLLAAGRNPVTARAMADLRPDLQSLISQILRSTRTRSALTANLLLALVDGVALGAVSEGAPNPRASVEAAVRAVLQADRAQPIQSAKDRPEIRS